VRYRSTFSIAGVTVLTFALSLSKPETRAEARLWRNERAWSDLQIAQRKPWADEVMEAIGRRPSPSPNQPAAQPQEQGRGQQGRGTRQGGGVGIRGGATPGAEGHERGRGEGGQPNR
jgi:hypothetical protein